jgi:hypothetical protein
MVFMGIYADESHYGVENVISKNLKLCGNKFVSLVFD